MLVRIGNVLKLLLEMDIGGPLWGKKLAYRTLKMLLIYDPRILLLFMGTRRQMDE